VANRQSVEPAVPGCPTELAPGALAELREGLKAVALAAEGATDPIAVDEVLELLEGCAAAGELAAAIYCGEYLEGLYEGTLPEVLVQNMFDALKPLLRPGARQPHPQLDDLWSSSSQGSKSRSKALNSRLGRIFDRLSRARREHATSKGGAAAQFAAKKEKGQRALENLTARVAKLLSADVEALACERRGPLLAAVTRVCCERGLSVSYALAWDILQELERNGAVRVNGREVKFVAEDAVQLADAQLSCSASELELLEGLARERLDRRKKRQRDRARSVKRRRGEG